MSKISAHESVVQMYEKLKKDEVTNIWDRWQQQESVRCRSFCAQGLSCQFCSNGPCRIIPGKIDRGTCGMDANGMPMRYMVLRNSMGMSTYTYHAREVAKTLIATGEGKTPYTIKDVEKLRSFAEKVGLDPSGDVNKLAIKVGNFLLEEINKDASTPLKIVEAFAPEPRKRKWRELGIIPGGPTNENIDAVSHCLTNVDGDYVSLAKTAMRLGLSCIYGSQLGLEMGQDILFGTPVPHEVNTDLGIVDPEYVNIVVDGHEPFVGMALIQLCHDELIQGSAQQAGARGIHVIGAIETGQEIIQRIPIDDVFVGLTGNWIFTEPLIATGAVDLFAMDMNCSMPSLTEYVERYPTTFVSVSPLVNIPGITRHIDYVPENVEEQAKMLVNLAVENFKRRQGKPVTLPKRVQPAIVGFSIESILSALGGSLDPLLDAIKKGDIKGVVALVSCTTLGNGVHDMTTIAVAKELIRRDILVLSAGCGNAALQVGGLQTLDAQKLAGPSLRKVCEALGIPPVLSFGTCTDTGRLATLVTAIANALGVDVCDLPVAVTAPEYMEQKATIDAVFAVAFGLYTHVSPTPPLIGGKDLVKLLTNDVEELTGGKFAVETDPVAIADGIEAHIVEKRHLLKHLGHPP
jgi:carbon-monoxide dehydrogenase catalytic subunit